MVLLQNIAPALMASIWQSAIAYVLLFAFRRSKHFNPQTTYAIGIILQFILVGLFSFNIIHPASVSSSFFTISSRNLVIFNYINNYISYIYIFLFLLNYLFRFFKNKKQNNYRFIERQSSSSNILEIEKTIEFWKSKLKIVRPVQLLFTSTGVIFTKYLFKPCIVLPLSYANGLSSKQMEAVLLHELWHIKRWDYLLLMLQVFFERVMYFNPFFLLIGKAVYEDREISCDMLSIKTTNCKSSDYVESLLLLRDTSIKPLSLELGIGGSTKSELYNRAAYLLEGKKDKKLKFNIGIQILALASCFWSLPIANSPNDILVSKISSYNPIEINPIVALNQQNSVSIPPSKQENNVLSKKHKQRNNIDKQSVVMSNSKKDTFKSNDVIDDRSSIVKSSRTDKSLVRMASYIQSDKGNKNLKFTAISTDQNKAVFCLSENDPEILHQIEQRTIQNIYNKFQIFNFETRNYVVQAENSTIEKNVTELLSDNYKFLIIKNNQKLLLAISKNKTTVIAN